MEMLAARWSSMIQRSPLVRLCPDGWPMAASVETES
jgi:hypothetical protein